MQNPRHFTEPCPFEAAFDFVERIVRLVSCNIRQCCIDIVAGVDGALRHPAVSSACKVAAVKQASRISRAHNAFVVSYPIPTSTVVVWLVVPVAFMCLSVCLSVCLFFHAISQKLMQLRSPNLTQKCSTMSPGNPFILCSKGERSRSRVGKNSAGEGFGTLCE